MNYLVTRRFADAVLGYLESPWPREVAERIHVVAYEEVPGVRSISAGATVLTDHERLGPALHDLAKRIGRAVQGAGMPVFNDPGRVLKRTALLRALHKAGINTFQAVPATEPLEGLIYPVFVREADEHTGTLTRLLRSRREVDKSIKLLTLFGGFRREDLLVVEYCDTRESGKGLFRKYSAFRVGNQVIPRYVEFSEHWVVKSNSKVVTQALADEEREFMQQNPHEAALRFVFDLAGIDYGRADYGVLNGRVQVWEINTNPRIGPQTRARGGSSAIKEEERKLRRYARESFHDRFREALQAIDRSDPERRIDIPVDQDLQKRVRAESAGFWFRDRVKAGLRGLRRTSTLKRLAGRLADRAVLLLFLVVFSSCATESQPTGTGSAEELVLENGLRVLLLPHPGSGLVASNVFVGAGSTREEARFAGSSHFLEHVLFNGTERRTQEAIYAEADRMGAYNNATTKQDYTHFMMVAPVERLADALDLQADMVLHSTLPEEKFEKERGIVLEEMSKDEDDPDYRLQQILDDLLFGEGNDYARPVLGTAATIAALPRDDVLAYYARQYVPSNMRLVLMGDFDRDAGLAIVRRVFGSPVGKEPLLPAPSVSLAAPGRFQSRAAEAPNALVTLVAALPEGTPEADAALALLAQIAGGTKSSRLERALSASPEVPHTEASAGFRIVQGGRLLTLQTRLEEGGDAKEAAVRMVAALRSLDRIPAGELEAAKTSLLSQEISQLEQLHYYAIFQGDRLWHATEGYTKRYLDAVEGFEAGAMPLTGAALQIAAAGPGLAEEDVAVADLEAEVSKVSLPQEDAGSASLRRPASALATDEPASVSHLPNGVTLIHQAATSTRMFALHLLVQDRSLREPKDLPGVADLLHRTMAVRAERSDSGLSLPAKIGASIKAADDPGIPYDDYYTTPLYSFVRIECIDAYYRDALSLLATMITGPHDDAAAFEEARTEMRSSLSREAGRPAVKASARFRELLYPGHPLARPVSGDTLTLSQMTHERLGQFAEQYFAPGALVLAVAGNVPRKEAEAAVEAALGSLRVSSSLQEAPPIPLTTESKREEIEGGGSQSSIRMGRVVTAEPADEWALIAAVGIASDRMQQDLRETRGLAYSLGVSVDFLGDRAILGASMGTRPENVAEAESGMLPYLTSGELAATPEEIEIAVNGHLSRMRMRRITSMGQAFALSRDYFQYGGIDYRRREAEGLAKVAPEDVARVAKRYLCEGPLVTVIAK